MSNNIEIIWHYCTENGLFAENTRDRFNHHIVPAVQRGESISDIAVHIRCHGRITEKNSTDIQNDIEKIMKEGGNYGDQISLSPAS